MHTKIVNHAFSLTAPFNKWKDRGPKSLALQRSYKFLVADPELELRLSDSVQRSFQVFWAEAEILAVRELRRNSCL